MKKIRLISILFAISILPASFAFAQTASTAGSAGAKIKSVLQQRMEDLASTTPAERLQNVLENVKQRNDEIASTTKSLVQKLVDKKMDQGRINILRGYTNAYDILANLETRVETRMAKMDAAGIDVSALQILLTTAQADIAVVKTDMQSFTDELSATTSTSTRKTILSDLQTENKKLLQDVKTARSDLVKVIESLKQDQENSTSTIQS